MRFLGEKQDKRAPLTGAALYANIAAVLLDDTSNDAQTQTIALVTLDGKEWFKYSVSDNIGHPYPCVLNLDDVCGWWQFLTLLK